MAKHKPVGSEEIHDLRVRAEDLSNECARISTRMDGVAQSSESIEGLDDAMRALMCTARDSAQMAIVLNGHKAMQASKEQLAALGFKR